ncbi:HAMP domain-containing histidine kinase [Deinococcus sp. HMF7604]|uniref:sensor histidine kinase n=1 Tax=Deinococcus betulae TaxID=2873312 RepID=UPI001CCA70B1|nr:HAMP domain-containing sensor histidine kinase [Deinococcus betulae]MBZ9750669.1 HAMP domain-containing histidine kinase [Deinococcus betulae]
MRRPGFAVLGRGDLLRAALPALLSGALLLAAFQPAHRALTQPDSVWHGDSAQTLLPDVQTYALTLRDPAASPQDVQASRARALASLGRAETDPAFAGAAPRLTQLRRLLRSTQPQDTAQALRLAQTWTLAAQRQLRARRAEVRQVLRRMEWMVTLSALLTGLLGTALIGRALGHARQAQQGRLARETQHRQALGMAAHELRRPLQALLLATDALRATTNLRAREKLLGVIEEQAAHLAARTELERLDGMYVNVVAAPQPTDLATLVAEVESARVRVRRPKGEVMWPVDSAQLRQVLENLVENALRYSAGPVLVTLEAASPTQGPQLRVTDRGPGLTPAQRATVLTAPHPLPRAAGGRGLGLPLAYRLALANGAQLTLHEAPGGGLEARVTFAGP